MKDIPRLFIIQIGGFVGAFLLFIFFKVLEIFNKNIEDDDKNNGKDCNKIEKLEAF